MISLYILEIILICQNQPKQRSDLHNRNLRNNKNHDFPQRRVDKNHYAGATFYNLLPVELKRLKENNKFIK